MSIDLGNTPVGSPPTLGEQAQLRTSFGLGAADTAGFGAFVLSSGTTTEVNAIADAEVGQSLIDTTLNRLVRCTGAATYVLVG